MPLNFDSSPYLRVWEQRRQEEQQNRPDPNLIGQNLMQGLDLAIRDRRQRELMDYQKQQMTNTQNQQAIDNRDKYGEQIDPNIDVGVNNGTGVSRLFSGLPKGVEGPQNPMQTGTGMPMIEAYQKWRPTLNAQTARPEFIGALPKDERTEFFKRSSPEYQADVRLKDAQAKYYENRPAANVAKSYHFVDSASRRLYDENMNPIDMAPEGSTPRVISDPYAGSEYGRREALSTGATNSVGRVKALMSPQVLNEIKSIKLTPGKIYAQLASSEAKEVYRNLYNAISNQLYLKTGATANPSEIENNMIMYMPAVNDEIPDMISRLDMLSSEAALFSRPGANAKQPQPMGGPSTGAKKVGRFTVVEE